MEGGDKNVSLTGMRYLVFFLKEGKLKMGIPSNVWPNFVVEGLLLLVFVVYLFISYPDGKEGGGDQ